MNLKYFASITIAGFLVGFIPNFFGYFLTDYQWWLIVSPLDILAVYISAKLFWEN